MANVASAEREGCVIRQLQPLNQDTAAQPPFPLLAPTEFSSLLRRQRTDRLQRRATRRSTAIARCVLPHIGCNFTHSREVAPIPQ